MKQKVKILIRDIWKAVSEWEDQFNPISERFAKDRRDFIEVEVDVSDEDIFDRWEKFAANKAIEKLADVGDAEVIQSSKPTNDSCNYRKKSEYLQPAHTWGEHSKQVNADMDALAHVLDAKYNKRIAALEKLVEDLEKRNLKAIDYQKLAEVCDRTFTKNSFNLEFNRIENHLCALEQEIEKMKRKK